MTITLYFIHSSLVWDHSTNKPRNKINIKIRKPKKIFGIKFISASKTGKRIIISISNTKKISAIKKNCKEYEPRLFLKGTNPHSNGDVNASENNDFLLKRLISALKITPKKIAIVTWNNIIYISYGRLVH